MIFQLYLFLFLLSIVLIIVSYFIPVNDTTYTFRMSGSLMLLILGLAMMTTGIDYKIGENETYVYGDNFTGYHWDYDYSSPKPPADAYLFHIERVDVYDNYTNSTFGFFFAILGGFSFALTFIELKSYRRSEDD